MRSAIAATAAFAAGALAVPFFDKRAIVTDWQIKYVTEIVTVTAGAEQAASSAVDQNDRHFGHHWRLGGSSSSSAAASTVAASSSVAASSPSSTFVAPTTSSTFVAPTTSSTYVAPTTSETYVPPLSSSSQAPVPTVESSSSTYIAPSTVQAPASSAAQSSAAASTGVSSGGSDLDTYSGVTVYHHNLHRSNHSAPEVAWNQTLADIANEIAQSCKYAHNTEAGNGGYGQNIAAGVRASNVSAIVTDLFYNGEVGWYKDLYGQDQPDMTNFEHYGHFTQIVWKDTVSVGCATVDCSGRPISASAPKGLSGVSEGVSPYFTVCNYYPPGNYANEYADNIGTPLNRATASWNEGGYTIASDSTSQNS